MENLEVLKQFGVTSLEDARELAELTDRIVANVKTIDESYDLEELERQTGNIAASLKAIDEDDNDLDELAEETSAIVTNLRVIEEQA